MGMSAAPGFEMSGHGGLQRWQGRGEVRHAGHAGTHLGEKLGPHRPQIDAGDGTVAHDGTATHDQFPDVAGSRAGHDQFDGIEIVPQAVILQPAQSSTSRSAGSPGARRPPSRG